MAELWSLGAGREDEKSVWKKIIYSLKFLFKKAGRIKANLLWNNEIFYITNTVDLPNMQMIQYVRGNLLGPDVAVDVGT